MLFFTVIECPGCDKQEQLVEGKNKFFRSSIPLRFGLLSGNHLSLADSLDVLEQATTGGPHLGPNEIKSGKLTARSGR